MAKQLFFIDAPALTHRGNNNAKLNGTTSFWKPLLLSESRGVNGSWQNFSVSTVNGPTSGLEMLDGSSIAAEWLSEPLSADFTISGTITANLWTNESNMSANAAINFLVERMDGATGTLTQIVKSSRTTESGTTATVENFTATPTSTACKRGDRLRVRVFASDAGTLVTGFIQNFYFDHNAAGTQGDSWIQFTENLTFEPAGDPGVLDQTDHSSTSSFGNTSVGTAQTAQAFVATQSTLSELRAWLSTPGSPTDNFVIEIQTDSAGSPSGTVIGTIATVAGSSLTGTLTQYTYATNILLTPGVTYWVNFRRSGTLNGTDFYRVGRSTTVVAGWTGAKGWDSGAGWTGTQTFSFSVRFGFTISTYYLTDTADSSALGTLETPYDAGATQGVGDFTTDQRIAQSFVAVGTTLTEIRVWIIKQGAPSDNLVIELQSDSSNTPSGTVIGTIATVAASTYTGSTVQYTYTCSIAVTAGTKYWIVFRRSGSVNASNYVTTGQSLKGLTPTAQWGLYNGSTWNIQGVGQSIALRVTCNSPFFITKAATTTPGSGSTNAVTNTATGPVTPTQITASAGGTAIEWYTPPLNAFTLGGKSKFNIRGLESNASANASLKAEIAITAGDGTGATVWGIADVEAITTYGSVGEINTSDTAYNAWVSGDDTAVTLGQRLRFRVFVDDSGNAALVTAFTATVSYNGASASAAGDTYVILPQAVTEQALGALPTTLVTHAVYRYN